MSVNESGAAAVRKKAEKRYVGGMLILSVSTLICKIIGLLFKIPMLGLIGIEGMAYFSSAYHIYILLLTFSTSGLPVALSMMTAKSSARGDRAEVGRIFGVSLRLLLPLGAAGSAILYFCAGIFSEWISIPGAEPAIKAISPTLFFICMSSAVRGYFQGHEIMLPTAVSQLIESVSKLVLGMGLAYAAISRGADPSDTAAAAIAGLTVGVAAGALYLTVRKLSFPYTKTARGLYTAASSYTPRRRIAAEMVKIALPVTVSASVTSIAGLADTAIITGRLVSSGWAYDTALALYSGYANLAVPLFNLPVALITPVAMSLVPALSAAVAAGEPGTAAAVKRTAFRITLGAAVPASLGLAVFARPVLELIYPLQASAVASSAPLLSVLASSVVFSCLITVTNAVLQAWEHPSLPIISIAAGTAVKVASEYLLVGSPLGIYGAPVSTVLCGVTVMLVNLAFVRRYTPAAGSGTVRQLLCTAASSAVAVGAAAGLYAVLIRVGAGNAVALIAAIAAAVLIYVCAALRSRAVTAADIEILPGGEKIARFLGKTGMFGTVRSEKQIRGINKNDAERNDGIHRR